MPLNNMRKHWQSLSTCEHVITAPTLQHPTQGTILAKCTIPVGAVSAQRASDRRIYRASRSIYSLGPSGLCPAEVRSFISIHQVAPATALLLLLLLLRACFTVVRQVSLSWILLYRTHR